MHQQDLRRHADERDGREVLLGVEAELVEQARIDHQGAADDQDGVAVGGRLGDQRGADVAARARMVLDVELLPQAVGQLRRKEARHHVDRASGRERRDEPHRPGGVGALRVSEAGREQRRAADQSARGLLHETIHGSPWSLGKGIGSVSSAGNSRSAAAANRIQSNRPPIIDPTEELASDLYSGVSITHLAGVCPAPLK
jgi:hypothetical protein